jgi:hypothetical protein
VPTDSLVTGLIEASDGDYNSIRKAAGERR